MNSRGRVSSGALIAVVAAVLLSGCADNLVERSYDGLPPAPTPSARPTPGQVGLADPDFGPRVQWADGGRLLSVSLFGSSTCPLRPSELIQVGRDRLEVILKPTGGPQCTADLKAVTHELVVPASVTKTSPVSVVVLDDEFTLPARNAP